MSGAACSGNTLTRACPSFTRTGFQNVFHMCFNMHHRLLAWVLAMASSMAYCLQSCYFVLLHIVTNCTGLVWTRILKTPQHQSAGGTCQRLQCGAENACEFTHALPENQVSSVNAVCGARRALLYLCQRIFEDHEMHAALTHIAALALDGSSQHPTARLSSSIRKAASKCRLQTLKQ